VRVLLVHPPLTVGRAFIDYPWATDLGIVQLAAVLRQAHSVCLVDAFAVPGAGAVRRGESVVLGAGSSTLLRAAADAAPSFDAAVVALTPFHRPPVRDALLGELLAGLRRFLGQAPLLLADCWQTGQHYVDADGGALLASYPEVDAWVKYEAETTVPELLLGIERGERPRGTLAGADADLDHLPAPAWDLVDLAARDRFQAAVVANVGRGAWPFPLDGRTLPAVTSRGCPFPCIHCSSNPGRSEGAPKRQRRIPRERIATFAASLARDHAVTRLHVLDEAANASPDHLGGILEATEAAGLALELPNGLRADRLDADALSRLHRRITTLSISAESGVQRVVDEVVRKRLDLAEVSRVAETCRELGLPLLVHFMIGLPGETPEEINRTLAYAGELRERFGAMPSVQFATPLPGTPLAQLVGAVNGDCGPRFQEQPSATDVLVPPAALKRFRWSFEQAARAAAPEKVIVNLTYRCNNHCSFCAVGNRAPRDADAAVVRQLLERHRAEGMRLVDFDGGEPTLHPELLALIGHARSVGYERIAVTTNGRRLAYDRFARALARSGVTTVLVSLHGPDAAVHERITSVPGSFEQTVAGIRNLVATAPPGLEVGVNTTVARDNAERLCDIAELVHRLGVRTLNLQLLTPFGRATREQACDPESAAEQVARVLEAWGSRLRVTAVNVPFCMLPGQEESVAPDAGKFGRRMAFVGAEEVNLAAYLAEKRVRRSSCAACEYAACCAGFYEMGDLPEPPWPAGPAAA
jgi:MoaA/NifB/PqqE/SkfB family radical SAM enzyme